MYEVGKEIRKREREREREGEKKTEEERNTNKSILFSNPKRRSAVLCRR